MHTSLSEKGAFVSARFRISDARSPPEEAERPGTEACFDKLRYRHAQLSRKLTFATRHDDVKRGAFQVAVDVTHDERMLQFSQRLTGHKERPALTYGKETPNLSEAREDTQTCTSVMQAMRSLAASFVKSTTLTTTLRPHAQTRHLLQKTSLIAKKWEETTTDFLPSPSLARRALP